MKGRIEVEIGIKVMDVPPEEVESFLLAFARIAANSDGAVKINPATQKVLQGMPAVQKALQAAPPALEAVSSVPSETRESMRAGELERRAEEKRLLAASREEDKARRRLEREAARETRLSEKAQQRAEWDKRRDQKYRDEHRKVEVALKQANYRVIVASKTLGMTPAGLYQKMVRLGFYTRKPIAQKKGGSHV